MLFGFSCLAIEKIEGKRGNSYRVRVSRRGHTPFNKTFKKYAEAKAVEARVPIYMTTDK